LSRWASADGVLDLLHDAIAGVVGDHAGGLAGQAGGLAQPGGDLGDLLGLGPGANTAG
jgi:hypothetical protein